MGGLVAFNFLGKILNPFPSVPPPRGVLPFTERKQSVMQSHEKIRQYKYHQSSSLANLSVGARVSLRSSPVYCAGGKGIHLKGTKLQCGILKNNVINPTLCDKCSFKVISGAEVAGEKRGGGKEEGEEGEEEEKEGGEMEHEPSEADAVHVGKT